MLLVIFAINLNHRRKLERSRTMRKVSGKFNRSRKLNNGEFLSVRGRLNIWRERRRIINNGELFSDGDFPRFSFRRTCAMNDGVTRLRSPELRNVKFIDAITCGYSRIYTGKKWSFSRGPPSLPFTLEPILYFSLFLFICPFSSSLRIGRVEMFFYSLAKKRELYWKNKVEKYIQL